MYFIVEIINVIIFKKNENIHAFYKRSYRIINVIGGRLRNCLFSVTKSISTM